MPNGQEFRRSMYVDGWSNLYRNPDIVNNLGSFCQSQEITELHFYELHRILNVLDNHSIHNIALGILKENYGIEVLNAAYSSVDQLDEIRRYQEVHGDFSGTILEYEWWDSNPRDFSAALDRLRVAKDLSLKTMAYTGWFIEDEVKALCSMVDVLHIHAYFYAGEGTFEYTKGRLDLLADQFIKIVPIFSAEPKFMKSWLQADGIKKAERLYNHGYNKWKSHNQNNVTKVGFNYFCYSYMSEAITPAI